MSREHPQLRIRLAPDLKDQIEGAAKSNNRSMNAEIVYRLEESFVGSSIQTDELLPITEARKVFEKAKKHLAECVRSYVIEEINEAIDQGKDTIDLDFDKYFGDLNDPDDSRFASAILPAISEVEKAGYDVSRDGCAYFTVALWGRDDKEQDD